MEEEVGTEVELHLPRDTLDDTPLSETQDTRKERNPKEEQREKEDSFWRDRKGFPHIIRVISTSRSEV